MNAMRKGKTPMARFLQQASRAKTRGIPWELTFEQWWSMWQLSGHWEDRGLGIGKFVMARHGDVGPYSVDNAFICPFEKNISDAHKFGPRKYRKAGKGRGWTLVKRATLRPYQVVVSNKYVGCFATQEEAEQAYRQASEAWERGKNFDLPRTVQ